MCSGCVCISFLIYYRGVIEFVIKSTLGVGVGV